MTDLDPRLLTLARDGDREARATVLSHFDDALRAYLRLRRGPLLEAQESVSDLVQSIYIAALDDAQVWAADDLDGLRRRVLLRADHRLIDHARYYQSVKRDVRRQVSIEAAENAEMLLEQYRTVSTPSQHLQAQDEVARIERAFRSLPDDYARVILLIRFMGLDVDEAASELGRTRAATWTLLSRALAKLALALPPSDL